MSVLLHLRLPSSYEIFSQPLASFTYNNCNDASKWQYCDSYDFQKNSNRLLILFIANTMSLFEYILLSQFDYFITIIWSSFSKIFYKEVSLILLLCMLRVNQLFQIVVSLLTFCCGCQVFVILFVSKSH